MSKIGISMSIDVTKLDKARFYKGEKGTYLSLTAFVNLDEKDQYDNNGFITQELSKEERDNKSQLPILGNSEIFFDDRESSGSAPTPIAPTQAGIQGQEYLDDDIPF